MCKRTKRRKRKSYDPIQLRLAQTPLVAALQACNPADLELHHLREVIGTSSLTYDDKLRIVARFLGLKLNPLAPRLGRKQSRMWQRAQDADRKSQARLSFELVEQSIITEELRRLAQASRQEESIFDLADEAVDSCQRWTDSPLQAHCPGVTSRRRRRVHGIKIEGGEQLLPNLFPDQE